MEKNFVIAWFEGSGKEGEGARLVTVGVRYRPGLQDDEDGNQEKIQNEWH